MCGIAGVMLKSGTGDIGKLLITMLASMRHRGPDSSGVAVYGPKEPSLSIRIAVDDERVAARVNQILADLEIPQGDIEKHPRYLVMLVRVNDETLADRLVHEVQQVPDAEIHSSGRSMTIIKDTVEPEDLSEEYEVGAYRGSHGIGHVRLATESKVDCAFAHPFQSLNVPDLSIVHNGTITNYHNTRRKLERHGYRFQTDNDSELIAQAIAYNLERGLLFSGALQDVANSLDGTFSFIVASPDEIGIAKDRLAAKPMMIAETDWAIGIASEEIAIRNIFGDEAVVRELPPSEVRSWKVRNGR